MIESRADIRTSEGSAYIRKLCKHFAHKIEVRYTEQEGFAALPTAQCAMEADADNLRFILKAETTEDLQQAEQVIVRHLLKFAYKEELGIQWIHQS